MMTRRAFLTTMAASAAVAAVYDPKALLWVPEEKQTDIVLASGAADIATQIELNELARRVAAGLSDRLGLGADGFIVRDVIYRHTGNVTLPAGLLGLCGVGPRQFEAAGRRLVTIPGGTEKQQVDQAVWGLRDYILHERIDMFAPIAKELRLGEPFSPDIMVGRATDPETGLSVRALRFHQVGVREWLTGFEVAGGHARQPKLSSKQLAMASALCALSTFGGES